MGNIKIEFSSRKLSSIKNVRTILSAEEFQERKVMVGWGKKFNTKKARAYALKHQLPFIALENGFLRSMDLGVNGEAPLSLVVDDIGIYYDTTQPSRLESYFGRYLD